MATLSINEAACVQFPMVRHAAGIGWKQISSKEAEKLRGGKDNAFFTEWLQQKLLALNPWLKPDAARAIIATMAALPPTIEGNRIMLDWLRGNCSWRDEKEKLRKPVRLIDFDQPANNVFHVTWEWKSEPPARKKGNRADVMFLINGIPVCIVEHKNPKLADGIERGLTQLQRYELETPELLAAPQLFNATHLVDYWYGVTWNYKRRFVSRWKEKKDESYQFAVQSFFEPTDFLRTLKDWILFYEEDGETRKSVLRQHQRRAVDAILARCQEKNKTRGLIWHTQGSGKTFTLLTAARLILSDAVNFLGATVILVVDRTELDGQLAGWVEKLVGDMQKQSIAVRRANTKRELQELLTTDFRGLIISMIHKFEGIRKDSCTRDNVFVFIDEAHRSVAKDLGTYLMAALPNATIIGFTGTPIAKNNQGDGTFKIFGNQDKNGYLDKYSIAESIKDETTLPIKHTMAPSSMTIPTEQLDREFFDLAETEGVSDINDLNRVLDKAVGLRTFLTADDRIEQVAKYVANHFKENVEPLGYKAFLVAVNREACAKYKKALDELLPPEWTEVVYSENVNDAVERPLVADLQLSPKDEEEVRLKFKKPAENPKILIVTDKLITGYDAPVLYCMYLDKPMRDHVLLQASARVNRPYSNGEQQKRIGLVVDFVGVLSELQKALRFDSEDMTGVMEDLGVLMNNFKLKMPEAVSKYLKNDAGLPPDEALERMVYNELLDPEKRKEFFKAYKEIEMLWEILSPDPELYEYIPDYKRLGKLYATVRNAYKDGSEIFAAELAQKTKRLIQEQATQEGLGILTKCILFDVATLEALRGEKGSDEGKAISLVRGLREEAEKNPALQSLKEKAENIVKEMENRKITGLAAMDMLAALAREKENVQKAAQESGLDPQTFEIHWALRNDKTLTGANIDSEEFARKVQELIKVFPNLNANPEEKRRFRVRLYPLLSGLEIKEKARIVKIVMNIISGSSL